MTKKIHLLILFFVSFLMQAQEPVSIHFSEKEGLPDKEFYDITEDDKGFIWLSAAKGLFRYDGKLFKSYNNKEQRGLSVFGIKQDHLGRIWCNNVSGQFFYIKDDKLHLFTDLSKLLKGELADFIVKGEYLWVVTLANIYKINLNTKLIEYKLNTKHTFGTPYKLNNTIYVSNASSILSITSKNSFKKALTSNVFFKDKNGHIVPERKAIIFRIGSFFF